MGKDLWGRQRLQQEKPGYFMDYNFDKIIDRTADSGSYSCKWQNYAGLFPGLNVESTIPMWVADMDFRVADEILDAMKERLQHGVFGYVSADSVDAFARACAGWLGRRHGLAADPAHMLFTPGVLCGLNAAIQAFTKPGDGIIIHSPVYYPFTNGIVDNGRVPVRNSLLLKNGCYEIDFENLESLARDPGNTMMILSSPHNPGGCVWTKEDLARIADLCISNNVFLFSDEIHSDLIMPGNRHVPILEALDGIRDRVIVAYAPSKTFNLAGLCASLMLVPNKENRERLQRQLDINRAPHANVFGLIAGEAAYTHGDRFADQVVAYIQENIRCFTDTLSAVPEIQVMKPAGTYLLWVDFNATGLPEQEIYRTIVEEGDIAPDLGCWFGPGGEGFARFNMACPRSITLEAAHRLTSAFSAICRR